MSEERIATLRVKLKTWEKQFSVQHGGKRPSREDIKNNVEIAAKYREYDRLRRPSAKQPESQHAKPTTTQHATPKKAPAPAATPQKSNSQFLLPSVPLQEEDLELEPTPAAVRMHLGPTPQKDGHILSLFDDLSSTASKPSRNALATIEANANFTPSKPSQLMFMDGESPPENVHDRTPASSSKRFLLDSFVSTTPLKRKREDDEPAHATPSSAKGLSTPAFLRRSSNMLIMNTLVEEAENDHELKSMDIGRMRQPPFKKRGIVRSLSSIIQGLRKQEDDKLDEELEMMREMEEGDEDVPSRPAVQVADSQVVMPLGPDQGIESEESEEEERDTGIFRKPWKKKGLKRQTKRTNMRPQPKPKAPVQTEQPDTTSDDEGNVAETQLPDCPLDDISDADSDAAYSDTEAKRKRQLTKTTTTDKDDVSKSSKGDGIVKKAARKISATAHANFRALKIKNKNSKANGRGRFGRR
ncbi:MAG: SPRY-domain-containing protein [Aureobasidium pullulans]|nr:MAG: SPRY-domain-containing protein [Aureobasidium pullulans]